MGTPCSETNSWLLVRFKSLFGLKKKVLVIAVLKVGHGNRGPPLLLSYYVDRVLGAFCKERKPHLGFKVNLRLKALQPTLKRRQYYIQYIKFHAYLVTLTCKMIRIKGLEEGRTNNAGNVKIVL